MRCMHASELGNYNVVLTENHAKIARVVSWIIFSDVRGLFSALLLLPACLVYLLGLFCLL